MAMRPLSRNRIRSVRRFIFVFSLTAYVAGTLSIIFVTLPVLLFLYFISQPHVDTYSKTNLHGDAVTLRISYDTDVPYHTTIALRRVHGWFSHTLMTATSEDYSVDVQWRGDNLVEVETDFGPRGRRSVPAPRVGPIRIVYHWGAPGAKTPTADFEPWSTCPAPYRSAYFPNCPTGRQLASHLAEPRRRVIKPPPSV